MCKTWETIGEVTSSKKYKECIPEYFKKNGEVITGSLEIANGFNHFFAEIGPKLANEIAPTNTDFNQFLGAPIEDNFIFGEVTPHFLYSILGQFM